MQFTSSGAVRGRSLVIPKYLMQSSAKYCSGEYDTPPSTDFSKIAALGGGDPKRMKTKISCRGEKNYSKKL